MKDIDINLKAFNKFLYNSVDLIYLFAHQFNDTSSIFWWICWPNIFITNDGIYYYDEKLNTFARFENNSEIYLWRTQLIDKEYLAFFKLYAKEAFQIHLHTSYDYTNDNLGTKRFWMYQGFMSNTQEHIPTSIIPLINKEGEGKVLLHFIQFYSKIWKKIIIKTDGTTGWKSIYIFDLTELRDINNFSWIIDMLKESGKNKIICMEFIDTKNYEIRLLWYKKDCEILIHAMYKKERLEGQILHNISQWNKVQKIWENDIPQWMEEKVKDFCKELPDNHGWLDIIISVDGKYYFTENNTLTWYLDTDVEKPFLISWLKAISNYYR